MSEINSETNSKKNNETSSEIKTETLIHIKVINSEGSELIFKMKETATLNKLMDAYCKRQGLQQNSVRFSFDGERISGKETVKELGLIDQDVIDVMTEQVGGGIEKKVIYIKTVYIRTIKNNKKR